MNKITFIIGGLGGGGAENVCVTLANGFVKCGIAVDLIVLNLMSDQRSSSLSSEVNLISLNCKGVRTSALVLLKYLKGAKPEKVLCFNRQISVLLVILRTVFGLNFYLISRNIIFLSVAEAKKTGLWHGWFIKKLIKYFYPKSDLFIAQAQAMKVDMIEYLAITDDKVVVINNPIPAHIASLSENEILSVTRSRDYILCIGRLEAQKRFDLAIRTFAKVRMSFPGLRLKILGTGSQDLYLRSVAQQEGIANLVDFEGYCSNTVPYFFNAALTLMTSEFEGFPNVLVESIALGTPVVSVDCPSGPSEIVTDDNGCLVTMMSDGSLENAIVNTLNKVENAKCVRNTSVRFKPKMIVDKYLSALGVL